MNMCRNIIRTSVKPGILKNQRSGVGGENNELLDTSESHLAFYYMCKRKNRQCLWEDTVQIGDWKRKINTNMLALAKRQSASVPRITIREFK
jgi:hypothetical protein